ACGLDPVDGQVPKPRVVADVVVDLAHAVEVDDEGQPRVRFEDREELLELERVRAELDVLLHLEHSRDDVLDPLVHERLAAADRDDWSRALNAGVHALLHREPRLVRLVLADLPAADAGDIAGQRRLEHQDERKTRAGALLLGDIAADLDRRTQWKFHAASLSRRRPRAMSGK